MKLIRRSSVLRAGLFALILAPVLAGQDFPRGLLDREIDKALADFQVPGLAIGIVKEGRTILLKGYGIKTAGGRLTETPSSASDRPRKPSPPAWPRRSSWRAVSIGTTKS